MAIASVSSLLTGFSSYLLVSDSLANLQLQAQIAEVELLFDLTNVTLNPFQFCVDGFTNNGKLSSTGSFSYTFKTNSSLASSSGLLDDSGNLAVNVTVDETGDADIFMVSGVLTSIGVTVGSTTNSYTPTPAAGSCSFSSQFPLSNTTGMVDTTITLQFSMSRSVANEAFATYISEEGKNGECKFSFRLEVVS